MIIGWLDLDLRWYLPMHQAVETTDFMCLEQCGACDVCATYCPPFVCGVCSYDPRTGHPTEPVPYPCPAVQELPERSATPSRTPTETDGNYRPRPRRGGTPSAEARERIKGRKF